MDFSYHNVSFDLKQLIKILCCDLQVTIHEGLVEVQADILNAIAKFVDNFHIEVTTLSAPQVCALLNHMCARDAGSQLFLGCNQVRDNTYQARVFPVEWSYPVALVLDRLPDHQTDIKRGSTHPTQMESEVDHFSRVL